MSRHYVKAFNSGAFSNHGFFFDELIINVNNGLWNVYDKIKGHAKEEEDKADIMKQ